jgi:hypothetical protein
MSPAPPFLFPVLHCAAGPDHTSRSVCSDRSRNARNQLQVLNPDSRIKSSLELHDVRQDAAKRILLPFGGVLAC